MNKHNPLVSIIIPTFNRENLLRITLENVLNQDYENWECIIINDESERDSVLKKEFESRDKRFIFFKRPVKVPKGSNFCRNYGFEKSNGNYIQWLDDDDLLSKGKIKAQVKLLEANMEDDVFITCPWDQYWEGKSIELKNINFEKNEILPRYFFYKLFEEQSFIPSHAYLIPRSLHINSGGWDVNLKINQDAEYFSRVLINSKKLFNISSEYVLYRMHTGDRISTKINAENLRNLIYSFQLIDAHVSSKGYTARKYLRWKLFKLLLKFWKTEKAVLKEYSDFFAKNKIYISLMDYYKFRYKVYRTLKPYYKKKN